MKQGGKVIWITGLSGAGKTTLACALLEHLPGAILLDGDDLRWALGVTDVHFDMHGRHKLAMSYARLAKLLGDQGFTVLVATISLFHEVHDWNRRNLPGYLEIFLDIRRDILMERDPKGLYGRMKAGGLTNMAGNDVAVELPLAPDIRFCEDDRLEICVEKILSKL